MPEETEYLGRTAVAGDGYMEPERYRVRCRCLRCGHEYSRIIKRISDPDPPCPKKACKAAIVAEQAAREGRHVEAMIETGKTPGHIGANVHVKAIDATAEIVMQDYGMTDLKDNTRQGDSMAPSLTPRQREMNKNFWGGGKMSDRKRNPTYMPGIGQKVQQAMAGAFLPGRGSLAGSGAVSGNEVLTDLHRRRVKPPVELVFDTNKIPKK